jgi:phosphoadenosine phosphosulfate reductase
MTQLCIQQPCVADSAEQQAQRWNQRFAGLTAQQRIEQVAAELAEQAAMTSSFGIHAAVSLHLINQVIPGIPVIMVDTGYLFAETYRYAEQLQQQLNLNIQVVQSEVSPARFEAIHGDLWNQGLDGLERYNQWRKVQPLEQALSDQHVEAWFSGVRRHQSELRQSLPWVQVKNQRLKVHPILDWTDRDLYRYQQQHGLPQHPLWDQGYLSVGDTHSTRSIHEVDSMDELRFMGLKRECGIHE